LPVVSREGNEPRRRRPAFEVDSKARLVDAGQAVDVQVTVTCPAGAKVLEAFLYVSQDGNQSRLTKANVSKWTDRA
jgi:hypothetical protein